MLARNAPKLKPGSQNKREKSSKQPDKTPVATNPIRFSCPQDLISFPIKTPPDRFTCPFLSSVALNQTIYLQIRPKVRMQRVASTVLPMMLSAVPAATPAGQTMKAPVRVEVQ